MGQQVLNGIFVGSIYALFAVGYTLVFGVLDILRDADGRMYICDCNNTPTGPSRRLSLPVQLDVIKTVAQAFEKTYLEKLRARRSSTIDALPTPAEETQSPQ